VGVWSLRQSRVNSSDPEQAETSLREAAMSGWDFEEASSIAISL